MTVNKNLKGFLLCSVVALTLPGSSAAQTNDAKLKAFANGLPDDVKRQLARRSDTFLRNMANTVFDIAPDGIVTKESIEIRDKRTIAGLRVREITQILTYDLDGDGSVSAREIEVQLQYLNGNQRGQLTVAVIENDTDGDGSLSLKEILDAAEEKVKKHNANRNQNYSHLMAFDYDGNGKVDLAEISSVVAAIDPELLKVGKKRRNTASPSTVLCKVPKPKDAEVVLLSGYQGAAISTLAVSGQEMETTVATVMIENGTTPLYIFATAYDSIVWKFDGATDRIQHLVVQPRSTRNGPGAAVAGVDASKVTFVPERACISGYVKSKSAKERAKIGSLSTLLGKNVDSFALSYTINNLRVPQTKDNAISDTEKHPYREPVSFSIGENSYELSATGMVVKGDEHGASGQQATNRTTIRELMRFRPGGLIPLSGDQVHAAEDVQPYEILPQEAGLLQLMAEGKIEFDRGTYVITKPIARFPAGLFGAHSVKFVLGEGVPMPAGSPGHSSVISGETGECLAGRLCR